MRVANRDTTVGCFDWSRTVEQYLRQLGARTTSKG
jgi:hypothetical protein